MKEYLCSKSIPDKLSIFPIIKTKYIDTTSQRNYWRFCIISFFFTHNITYLTKLNLHSSAARLDCLIKLNDMFTLKTDRKLDIDFYGKYVWILDT